jgi:hypothetical protein
MEKFISKVKILAEKIDKSKYDSLYGIPKNGKIS